MEVRLDNEARAARVLGKRGGLSLAAKWQALQLLAAAGDLDAQRKLEKQRKAMSERGRKGGRPRKAKP